MKKSAVVTLFSGVALLFGACTQTTTTDTSNASSPASDIGGKKDSVAKAESPAPALVPEVKPLDAQYTFFRYKDSGKQRMRDYTAEQKDIIYTLNRVDASNLRSADTLIVPTTWPQDRRELSPFPQSVASLREVNKFIIFSYPIQAYAIYTNGVLEKWGPTSMGSKIHKTPTGLFFTNWKSKESISTSNDEWILKWNFNISNHGGVGFHQYALPGIPASHSCLRLLAKDAEWLYSFADQWKLDASGNTVEVKGTPVLVYGEYPWGARRPWRNLLDNPKANDVSEAEITSMMEPHLAEIATQQQKRAALPVEAPKTTDTAKTAMN